MHTASHPTKKVERQRWDQFPSTCSDDVNLARRVNCTWVHVHDLILAPTETDTFGKRRPDLLLVDHLTRNLDRTGVSGTYTSRSLPIITGDSANEIWCLIMVQLPRATCAAMPRTIVIPTLATNRTTNIEFAGGERQACE